MVWRYQSVANPKRAETGLAEVSGSTKRRASSEQCRRPQTTEEGELRKKGRNARRILPVREFPSRRKKLSLPHKRGGREASLLWRKIESWEIHGGSSLS